MTDNIETMRGVIADALSNPAGTCANSCEGNAYQIEIRRLIADRAKLEERLEKAEQALSRAGFVRNELYGEWKPPVNRAAAALCDTRNGRGEIGGFHGGAAPGYVTEPCPDCAGAQHERQDASDEGQGHNQEIRS